MPVDPGPCRWNLPDPAAAPRGTEVVAIGGDLAPATLLAGYRRGLFPMPSGRALLWFSPDPRGVLPLDRFHASRSLRRSAGRFEVSVDRAFDAVLAACADPDRPGGRWITAAYARSYRSLHAMGWAHSVEVWRDGLLAGGLLGIEIGGLFCGESMVHLATDASKVALWAAVALLAAGGSARIFDVQWSTPHLATLGVVEMPRARYLASLPAVLQLPAALAPAAPRPARSLLQG